MASRQFFRWYVMAVPALFFALVSPAFAQTPFTAQCGAVPSTASVGQTVEWKAVVYTTGTTFTLQDPNSFYYQWSGNYVGDGVDSMTSPVAGDWYFNTTYKIPGTKTVSVIVSNSSGWSSTVSCSASISGDTTPPTTPTNLAASLAAQGVSLSWSASTDNMGVTGYNIYRNGSLLGSTASLGYTDTTTVPATTYTYTVSAFDAAGNTSAQSAGATITTAAPPQSTTFTVGESVQTTSAANVRATPSTSGTLIKAEPAGTVGTIAGGPTYADGYWWWRVSFSDGTTGWTIENNLASYTPPPPPPPQSYTISVTTSGSGLGTVTGGPINCGSVCSGTVTGGTSVTLTATPVSGSSFTGWSGGCSGNDSCTISANTSVTATFNLTRQSDNGAPSSPGSTVTSGITPVGTVYPTQDLCNNGGSYNGVSYTACPDNLDCVAQPDNTYLCEYDPTNLQSCNLTCSTSCLSQPSPYVGYYCPGTITVTNPGAPTNAVAKLTPFGTCPLWTPGTDIVPCDNVTNACDFNALMCMANNIIDALIYFSVLVAVAMFAFAGFKYLTAGGDMGAMKQARSIFTNVAIGFIFVLGAWLIVTLILQTLVSTSNTGLTGANGVLCKTLGITCG